MGLIGKRIREIKDLSEKQESLCTEIRNISKEKPLLVIKDTWSKPQSRAGFNYKGRVCYIQDLYIQRGEIWIKPKFLNLKTKKFTIETTKYYREDHFKEISSYENLAEIIKSL
jgi:hypothetical protein